ncbi:MAG: hypothetical protein ACK5LG_22080 [Bacteroides thetaiotaomicron]
MRAKLVSQPFLLIFTKSDEDVFHESPSGISRWDIQALQTQRDGSRVTTYQTSNG